MASDVLVLSYDKCGTCKKALAWLAAKRIAVRVRPIVDEPPSAAELARWIAASGVGVRKWLNTSGQSYRALGKAKVDAATDDEIARWLAKDGKLVKRPVVVLTGGGQGNQRSSRNPPKERVLVGFRPEAYAEAFAGRAR
jgi:arsenate reductase